MLFHTFEFLVFFAVLIPCFLLFRRLGLAPMVLLAFSQVFYGWWDWRFLILLWITIIVDYGLALALDRAESPGVRKAYLTASIVSNLLLLGFFKYWNFITDSLGMAWTGAPDTLRIDNLILPVGISFYTFQSMGYVIDVYRRHDRPVKNLIEYAAFVCYFPHMVAGPIMRIGRLLPSLIRPAPITSERVLSGITLFAYGFVCKAIGDVLAKLHDPTFSDLGAAQPYAVVLAVFSFGIQIYFDFAGYTEMARGVSRILGIELMRNFRSPYTATSFQEFWRRWHISLSEWLRDYLYISLGGNRVGRARQLANLMITMLLGGLWHGAGWNFLIWGGLHGSYLVVNHLWMRTVGRNLPTAGLAGKVRSVIGWVVTLIGVMYAWLYFRIPTFGEAWTANQKIGQWLMEGGFPRSADIPWALVALIGCILLLDLVRRNDEDLFPAGAAQPRRALAFGLASGIFVVVGLVLLIGAPSQQFIYFQF